MFDGLKTDYTQHEREVAAFEAGFLIEGESGFVFREVIGCCPPEECAHFNGEISIDSKDM